MAADAGPEELLKDLAGIIERIIERQLGRREVEGETREADERRNGRKEDAGGGSMEEEEKRKSGKRRDVAEGEKKKRGGRRSRAEGEGLPEVLDLVQKVLKDGSLQTDYMGREECRTFVLGDQGNTSIDLFGSASIEGWLQLQLSSQSLTQRLRDLYSQRKRVRDHYSPGSISRDPVLRQTFLLCLEALEEGDLERLHALKKDKRSVTMLRKLRPKSRRKQAMQTSLRSTQLDLGEHKEEERSKLGRAGSLPVLSPTYETSLLKRRGSLGAVLRREEAPLPPSPPPEEINLELEGRRSTVVRHSAPGGAGGSGGVQEAIQRTSAPGGQVVEEKEGTRKVVRGHQRVRSDTSSIDFSGRGEEEVDSRDITGDWAQVVPATTGWFPRPRANQSLVQFLAESGGDSEKKGRRAQLDRENAHFILSEAMISTFEQMNFERKMREMEEEVEGDSDDEIRSLKEKLRKRRSELKKDSVMRKQGSMILSDGQTDTTTTDQSASPAYSSPGDEGDTDAALFSDDEDFSGWERRAADGGLELPGGSAESIALSLLSRVGSGRLPPADQLTWLVSREEVDQDLLPLPSSLPVDPELSSDLQDATELRGTLTWAPPRPQIVLTVQEKPKKKLAAMMAQKMMCSGCGMKVETRYHKSFRFCNYLGRYFCTGCHENQGAIIPAKVIYHWDFKKYPVSNFSLDILHSMAKEPVFNVHEQNPALLRKIEKLKQVALARTQLSKLARYVSNCRLAPELHANIEASMVTDNEMYSLEDFTHTRSGALAPALRSIISEGLAHVKGCQLCQAQAFICEGCHSNPPIFPFQSNVLECPECHACYHKSCYSIKTGCVKCQRKQLRQQLEPAVC